MKKEKCDGDDVKREDCDETCRNQCTIYKEGNKDFDLFAGMWEFIEPMEGLEKHLGVTANMGVWGKPFALSARVGSTIFISFKGSGTGAGDWFANGNLVSKPFTTVRWNLPGQQPHIYAHQGFIRHYNAVKSPIFNHVDRMMRERAAFEIHVSGHSLGGAMANLCAVDFAAKYPNVKVALWTFGAPRVFRGSTDEGYFDAGKDSARNGG